jgi:hypothetical protein
MPEPVTDPAGLAPGEWERRLEAAAEDPRALGELLSQLDHELHQEGTWLHANPSPGKLLKTIFRFFGRLQDDDLEHLGEQIKAEMQSEHQIRERYRSWLPGEIWSDRLVAYLKDFAGPVEPDAGGLQFPGFQKYTGVLRGQRVEAFALFLNQRFPGRDPANFHIGFDPPSGELVIERVYRMELPRRANGPSPARAVLAEMIAAVTPSPQAIRSLVVDNAANLQTRKALLVIEQTADSVAYHTRPDAYVGATALGHLMRKLAAELGLRPGQFQIRVNSWGVLKISLPVDAQASS